MKTKYCPSCKKDVDVELWTKAKKAKDGLQSSCKDCRNKQRRLDRQNKKGHYAHERERYREQHLKACSALYYRCKKQVFDHYCNGVPCCKMCGFDDPRALSIDHIEGNGNDHRRQLNGVNLCKWIVKNNYPDNFQILCMNCQFIKRHEQSKYGVPWGNTSDAEKDST